MEVSRDCELCFEEGGALIEHGGCTDNPDHEKFIWMSLETLNCALRKEVVTQLMYFLPISGQI